ncbi:MAG: thioether cross-link-forming SCIFF peptide maturase [Eubacteriales bacterium]|nr:thioether cross-link-forming SCIFF peptide maturase [Eubacteriales bacterium]
MIHSYKMNGYNIILDQNSGCVHSVDDVAYDIINMYSTTPKEEIAEYILNKYNDRRDVTPEDIQLCFEDIEGLIAEGRLFAEDSFEATAAEFKKRQGVIKAICLHVAHGCNLNCEYCFAGKGEYGGTDKGLMSVEVGKRALDYLVEQSGSRKNLEVDFFGGEPLLNWDVCKELVKYGRELEKKYNKNFRFTLTTNGVLVDDEVIDFCNKEMSNVVLSLDGRKEVHDRLRKTPLGGGSYDQIVPKFKKFADNRNQKDYYIRGTYTHYNRDFAADLIHMADLGFKELSVEPVVCDPKEPWALKQDDLPILKEQYQILANEMLRRYRKGDGFTFYHYMIDLDHGPCIVKRISGCGVGTEYMAVTPGGDLYPCHQFVGDDKFLIGNIYDGVTHPEVLTQFEQCNVYSHKECKDCFAKLYCSGGCAANAYHTTGSVNGVYEFGCELHRKRIECAIMLKVAEAEENLNVEY